jgi:hypothetical protein
MISKASGYLGKFAGAARRIGSARGAYYGAVAEIIAGIIDFSPARFREQVCGRQNGVGQEVN